MLNTMDINGLTAYVGADESGVGLVASNVAFSIGAAGAVLVQLTDKSHDSHRIRYADFLRHYQIPNHQAALDRFVVVNNYRLHIQAVDLAERIQEATAQFEDTPRVVLLDLANAMLPTYPDNHMLAVVRELPKHLPETSVILGINYGHPATPAPKFTDYPGTVWLVTTFRTYMFTLAEQTPGQRVLKYLTKQANGGLIIFEPVEKTNV
jgi:hypothetical protein